MFIRRFVDFLDIANATNYLENWKWNDFIRIYYNHYTANNHFKVFQLDYEKRHTQIQSILVILIAFRNGVYLLLEKSRYCARYWAWIQTEIASDNLFPCFKVKRIFRAVTLFLLHCKNWSVLNFLHESQTRVHWEVRRDILME